MIELRSSILWGRTYHERSRPLVRSFSYPLMLICIKLDELKSLKTKLLSYNRYGVFSLWDRDFIRDSQGALAEKVAERVRSKIVDVQLHSTFLLTVPRFLGYVFNPVSFYVSFTKSGELHSLVAEVTNTFGEVHLYVLDARAAQKSDGTFTFYFPKEFYVSPFLDLSGEYRLSFCAAATNRSTTIDVLVELLDEHGTIFKAGLYGETNELSDINLLLSAIRYAASCWLTMLRIKLQAIILLMKKVGVFPKPHPINRNTVTFASSWLYRWRIKILNWLGTPANSRGNSSSDGV